LVGSCSDQQVRETWLRRIAEGSRVTVTRPGTDIAPDVHVSTAVIILDSDRATLYPVDEVTVEPLRSMDPSSRLCRVTPAGRGIALADADIQASEARRSVAVAALLTGVAAHLLEDTVEYASIRRQFDRPIGSFQAIKHQLAQAYSLNQLARAATLTATRTVASRAADGDDAATMALICAADAEAESNRVALQVHGGVGFTWEHDLQLWLKFGKTLELAHFTRRNAAARAGATALGEASHDSLRTARGG
jgi:hypothetical protein